MFSNAEENFRHSIRLKKFWRRDARGFPLQTKKLFPINRPRRPAGRDPTVPQSRDWSPKAKCIKPVRRPALPGLTSCSRACGMKLPFLILHILSIPVKHFGCGYAALSFSWSRDCGMNFSVVKVPAQPVKFSAVQSIHLHFLKLHPGLQDSNLFFIQRPAR